MVLGVSSPPPAWPPTSPSTQHLARLADIDPKKLGDNFALDNLLPLARPSRLALREAGELYRFLPTFWYLIVGTETIRALGKRVLPAKAKDNERVSWSLSSKGLEPFVWYENREGIVMATLPHPSGNNPWYNDAKRRGMAEAFLRDAAWTRRDSAHKAWVKARTR